MLCKLCGADKKLVKAHIIPEAFFEKDGNDSEFESFLYTFDPSAPRKRAPIGVYDKELLCIDCERKFQRWDDYGTNILLKRFNEFLAVETDGRMIGWRLDDYDYNLLKMFVIDILWRSAASSHVYFTSASLGPFEQLAKQAILSSDPGDSDFFATVFGRWHSTTLPSYLQRFHASPYKDRNDGINTLRLYMGELVAYVKVDKRPFSHPFRFFQLRDQIPLVICARDLGISDEFNKTNEFLLRRNELI